MRLVGIVILLLSSVLFSIGQERHVLFSSGDEGAKCYRIPALITAKNGDLIAAIDQRVPSCSDLKWNDNINIAIRRSTDNGKTWLPLEVLIDYPDSESASDPSLILDKETGEIFLFFNYMNLTTEKDIYYFRLISSKDNGKSWSEPFDITHDLSIDEDRNDFKFITSGRGIQTSDGILLHTIVNLEKGLFVFKSDDHGRSWHTLPTAIEPGDESKIVQLPDGSWLINSRVNGTGYRTVHISYDEGITWESRTDSTLIDPGCNASLIRAGEMLLFSNLGSNDTRENLQIRISEDSGRTWSLLKSIYPGSAAYSSITLLESGSLGILYEREDYGEIMFETISLSDN